jgi:hypothetical protein
VAGEAADLCGCVCIQRSCDARPKQIWRALRTRWVQTNLAGDRGFRLVFGGKDEMSMMKDPN